MEIPTENSFVALPCLIIRVEGVNIDVLVLLVECWSFPAYAHKGHFNRYIECVGVWGSHVGYITSTIEVHRHDMVNAESVPRHCD